MDIQNLTVEKREVTGRKVKNIRKEGKVPANIFGKGVKSTSISVTQDSFNKVYEEAGETGIVELALGKTKKPALISNVQTHPVTGDLLHIDFRQVDLTKKIITAVPVELTGESPAEKSGLGTVVQNVDEVEVEALPTDFPESFEISIENLNEVDDTITVGDIKFDSSKLEIKEEKDREIARVEPPQKEEEIAPATDTETQEDEEGEAAGEEAQEAAENQEKEEAQGE